MQKTDETFHTGKVAGIAGVHFIHDIYTSLLAPILPLLIKAFDMTLTQAGSLSIFMQIPSLFNPFLGSFADRKGLKRLFLIISPALTATLMCLMGFAGSYALLALILFAAGISVAALHVSAPVIASSYSGRSIGTGMSFFMVGGELSRAAGPLVAVWAVSAFGLEGIWRLMFAGWAASLLLWWRIGGNPEASRPERAASFRRMFSEMRLVMTGVFGVLIARAFLASSIVTYLPTLLVSEGSSLWLAGISLSVFEAAGVFGVFTSGILSDRIGRRKVLLGAACISPIAMLLVLNTSGAATFAALMLLGFTTLATGPVLMAAMLENAGDNKAAANGMYMAVSFAVRASVILVIGMVSDHYGMRTAFVMSSIIAFLGIPFIALLPGHRA